jgi:spore maturation protein CgeB
MNNILFLNPVPLIEYGIRWGFKQNGWNTYIMDGRDFVLNQPTHVQISKINECVERYNIDMIFWDFGVGADFVAIHQYCQSKGVCFVCWGIEDVIGSDWMNQTINHCDLYFTTVEENIPLARNQYNKEIDLLMFGVNPEYHTPTSPNKISYPWDIVLVANNYSSRYDKMDWFLRPLTSPDYNLAVFGNEWWVDGSRAFNLNGTDKYKGYFSYNDLASLYSTVPVALGVNCHDKSMSQQSMRIFEYAGWAHNSCLVSFHTPAQERYFGDMVYSPKTDAETILAVNEVLGLSDVARTEKSNVLRQFAYANHNYVDRAKIVINKYKGIKG